MDQSQPKLLQETYPTFSFDSYQYAVEDGKLVISFEYHCQSITLHTVDTISGVTSEMVSRIKKETLDAYVFHLGIAEIPSYWKAFCSPTVAIHCGHLDPEQTSFWQTLFFHGLGEFFYQNQIHPFAPAIESGGQATGHEVSQAEAKNLEINRTLARTPQIDHLQPMLVPVGGGKDSIVTLELLAAHGYPIYTWSGLEGASSQVIDLFGKRHPRLADIIFGRTLDPVLQQLNAAGHPNGHTPFSSVLAFFTLLTAALYDIPTIAVSNEGSSNEATGTWMGIDVNHQYSKSIQFEEDFQRYVTHTFAASAPYYFSFLRPLDELTIMKLFVNYPEYFSVFRSCNVGQKTRTWCGSCAKCVFVALLLGAYLDDATITAIFGKDMFADRSLVPLVDALVGKAEFKPFECVGTRSESRRAIQMAIAARADHLPALLAPYADLVELPSGGRTAHHLPEALVPIIAPYV